MIVAMAVVNGFNHSIAEKLYGFLGHVHIVPYDLSKSNSLSFAEPIYNDPALITGVAHIPHVTGIVPFTANPAILQGKGSMEGITLKGVDNHYKFLPGITLTGTLPDYSDSQYAKQITISKTTAARLNIGIGDTVQLDFLENGVPRLRRVRISGLFHSGMEEVDKTFAICDTRLLQRIKNWPADSINGYQVNLDNEMYADTVASFIHDKLLKPPLEAYTTRENYAFIFDWLKLQGMNGTILLIIMAIVAVINMGSILLILMVDRVKMIGLMKALGMTYEDTRSIFLYIAGMVAGAGIVLGNIMGLTLCWLQQRFGFITLPEETYYMRYAPIKVVVWQVAMIDAATLVICVLCMWLPSLYIRRIHPARVLQFK